MVPLDFSLAILLRARAREPAWQPAVEARVLQRFLPREVGMFSAAWRMLKERVLEFINDEALSLELRSPSTP
jgi:hypothetical protein